MTSRPIRFTLGLLLMGVVAVAIAIAGHYGTGYVVLPPSEDQSPL